MNPSPFEQLHERDPRRTPDVGERDPRGTPHVGERNPRRTPTTSFRAVVPTPVALGSLCALAFACAGPTEIHVYLDVDDTLLPRERVLEVSASDDEGNQIYRDEQLVGGTTGIPLPTGLRVLPRAEPELARLSLALRAGPSDVLVQRDVQLAFAPGQVRIIELRLDAACEGVRCDEGMTCACASEGCTAPDCVQVGACDDDRLCTSGRVQRCDAGAWAPTCEDLE